MIFRVLNPSICIYLVSALRIERFLNTYIIYIYITSKDIDIYYEVNNMKEKQVWQNENCLSRIKYFACYSSFVDHNILNS